jgi:ABC-type methionine transport system ATPase subunit
MAVVSRLNRNHGLTVLLVTHQLRMLQELASTVFWVQDGRVTRRRLIELMGIDPLLAGPAGQ